MEQGILASLADPGIRPDSDAPPTKKCEDAVPFRLIKSLYLTVGDRRDAT